jgi:hypothetical protein
MNRTAATTGTVMKGIVAGIAGGLVASWVMNQFQSGWSRFVDGEAPSSNGGRHDGREWQDRSEDANANERAAQKIAAATIDRSLTKDELKIAAPLVHYAFGTALGAIYGGFCEMVRAGLGTGAAYGTLIWIVADEIAVPATGLSDSPQRYPFETHAQAFASHIVYGMTTDIVRRGVRALM